MKQALINLVYGLVAFVAFCYGAAKAFWHILTKGVRF
jgi:hypothetical protein